MTEFLIDKLSGLDPKTILLAYTTGTSKPVEVWTEANNQLAAREKIMRENPYVSRLQYQRSKRIE